MQLIRRLFSRRPAAAPVDALQDATVRLIANTAAALNR